MNQFETDLIKFTAGMTALGVHVATPKRRRKPLTSSQKWNQVLGAGLGLSVGVLLSKVFLNAHNQSVNLAAPHLRLYQPSRILR